jgi:hypothetical protein
MALLALFRSIAIDAARRAARMLAGYLMVGSLMVAGLAFLTLAGYSALSHGLGDIAAALIVGGTYVVISLIALMTLQFVRR